MKIAFPLAVSLALLAGCGRISTGVIDEPCGARRDDTVPNIRFTGSDGKKTSLDKVRQDITIVGFTAAVAGKPFESDPVLAGLATDVRYNDLPVGVVQIVEPPPNGDANAVEIPATSNRWSSLMTLLDRHGFAREAFGKAKPGDVFLVDWNNQVVDAAKLDHLGYLPQHAELLGRDAWQFRNSNFFDRSFGGGRR